MQNAKRIIHSGNASENLPRVIIISTLMHPAAHRWSEINPPPVKGLDLHTGVKEGQGTV